MEKIKIMKEAVTNLLIRKLGCLSRNIFIKINTSNEDELIINIFGVEKEGVFIK